jgi:DNA helicase-2/ATP-dependent DNA helicase PcrA
MTIHAAKGLEFPVVYVVGLEENLFPSMLSLESREDLEEERRLFYVAITRAMKKLNLSYATTRYKFGQLLYCEPSRFIEEIPEQHLEFPAENVRPQPALAGTESFSRGPKPVRVKPERNLFNYTPSANFTADDPAKLEVGMEVEHVKFGHGKIETIEGSGNSRIATIVFDTAGDKRIMLKYAKVMIVSN